MPSTSGAHAAGRRAAPAGPGGSSPRRAGPPPRALALAGWALLPLRAFLGFTFCFAGLQKLANPNFFNGADPAGIRAQLIAAERVSPLPLLGHLLRFSTPLGLVIALAEVAVGLGTLCGLWTRLAAAGGALLSLMLFMTVSFHSSPYYTGADIVFVFAWLPLILAGAGGVLSVDGWIARRADVQAGRGRRDLVAVPFSVIQQVCGHYRDDRCDARGGAPCAAAPCPFLAAAGGPPCGTRPAGAAGPADPGRRRLVTTGAAVAVVGAVGLAMAGLAAAVGRAVGGAPRLASGTASLPGASATTTPTTARSSTPTTGPAATTTVPGPTTTLARPPGTAIGPARDVPVGGAASFQDPRTGDPALALQLTKGQFVAYDAVCPHAGCTVGYSAGAKLLVCPCHGSEFEPATGAVIQGPATRGRDHRDRPGARRPALRRLRVTMRSGSSGAGVLIGFAEKRPIPTGQRPTAVRSTGLRSTGRCPDALAPGDVASEGDDVADHDGHQGPGQQEDHPEPPREQVEAGVSGLDVPGHGLGGGRGQVPADRGPDPVDDGLDDEGDGQDGQHRGHLVLEQRAEAHAEQGQEGEGPEQARNHWPDLVE